MRNHSYCCCDELTAAQLGVGRKAEISALRRGRGFRAKMLGLGVRPGTDIEILADHGSGPCVIQIGRQKVMLGREMLSGIIIKGENS